jgi:hypothetical protein
MSWQFLPAGPVLTPAESYPGHRTIDTGVPAYYATEVELSQRGVVAQQKLILPLSSSGRKVDAVLAGIYPELPRKPRKTQRRADGGRSPG